MEIRRGPSRSPSAWSCGICSSSRCETASNAKFLDKLYGSIIIRSRGKSCTTLEPWMDAWRATQDHESYLVARFGGCFRILGARVTAADTDTMLTRSARTGVVVDMSHIWVRGQQITNIYFPWFNDNYSLNC